MSKTRDIKFRFWDKKENKFTDYGAVHLYGAIMTRSYTFGGMYDFVGDDATKDIIVQQFTGLKDRNGKEIYEGDIVRLGKNQKHCIVVWNEIMAGYMIRDGGLTNELVFYEVIGNIYETPELLEAR